MIVFSKVSKIYKDKKVLQDIDLEIKKGELVVLIGPSGCGKTTTLKMINRIIEPTGGTIFINGKSVHEQDIIKLRRNIGYVIQQTGLFPHLTIKENIEVISRLENIDEEDIEKKTIQLMNMVDLDAEQYLHRYPKQLSGGQQQRIGVARAFATDPDIILMDEPFSALDPITRGQLQDELLEIQSQYKKTIVFVTHDMDEAIKLADRICIMDGGNIVQYDTPENILKNPANEYIEEFIGRNRIWSNPELIKARDIMNSQPITVYGNVTLLRGLEKMRSNKVDKLFVTNQKKQLLGVVTARMIQGKENKNELVGDVMRTEYTKVAPGDSIIDLLKLVQERKVSTIPVVDEQGVLVGVVTTSGLVTTLSQQYIEVEEVEYL